MELLKEIEILNESTLTRDVWKEKLDCKKVEVKKMSADRIGKSFDEIMDYVQNINKEKQVAAADIFNNGADAVAAAAEFVLGNIMELIGA